MMMDLPRLPTGYRTIVALGDVTIPRIGEAPVLTVSPAEFAAVRALADACETVVVGGSIFDEERWVREIKKLLLDPRGLEVGAFELRVKW